MNRLMISISAIPVKIWKFAKEHTFLFILIVMPILSYFVYIPYLSDIVRGVVEVIMEERPISFGK